MGRKIVYKNSLEFALLLNPLRRKQANNFKLFNGFHKIIQDHLGLQLLLKYTVVCWFNLHWNVNLALSDSRTSFIADDVNSTHQTILEMFFSKMPNVAHEDIYKLVKKEKTPQAQNPSHCTVSSVLWLSVARERTSNRSSLA